LECVVFVAGGRPAQECVEVVSIEVVLDDAADGTVSVEVVVFVESRVVQAAEGGDVAFESGVFAREDAGEFLDGDIEVIGLDAAEVGFAELAGSESCDAAKWQGGCGGARREVDETAGERLREVAGVIEQGPDAGEGKADDSGVVIAIHRFEESNAGLFDFVGAGAIDGVVGLDVVFDVGRVEGSHGHIEFDLADPGGAVGWGDGDSSGEPVGAASEAL